MQARLAKNVVSRLCAVVRFTDQSRPVLTRPPLNTISSNVFSAFAPVVDSVMPKAYDAEIAAVTGHSRASAGIGVGVNSKRK
jgi:hypothetical protein